MEMKKLTKEMIEALKAPFPAEAISQNPKKSFLSTIKAYYIIERLNDVFGVGTWQLRTDYISTYQKKETTKEGKERDVYEVLAKATLDIQEYNIHLEQLGGGEDFVLGDAAKGATTDALNKCASYLYVGYDVFKGNVQPAQQQPVKKANKFFDFKIIDEAKTVDELTAIYNEYVKPLEDGKQKETAIDKLSKRKVYLMNGTKQ